MKFCKNCKQDVEPQKKFSWQLFILIVILAGIGAVVLMGINFGVILTGIGAVVYLIYYFLFAKEVCPVCHASNWKKGEKRIKTKGEKVIKIGKFRINQGTLCVGALVMILTISSAGFMVNQLAGNQGEDVAAISVMIAIDFGNVSQFSDTLFFEERTSAELAFREVANLTTELISNGVVVTGVSRGDISRSNTETHKWVFYINGRLIFSGLEQYFVRNGDIITLRYEEEPY